MVVVFDIGNVLLRWNPRNLFRKVFADEDEMEAFLAKACAMDWIVETDRARSFQPALDARIAAYPQYARELRLFDELWIETLGDPIHETSNCSNGCAYRANVSIPSPTSATKNSRSPEGCIRSSIPSTGSSCPAGKGWSNPTRAFSNCS